MHVLIALTYFRPHYSGLTIYADRLARALAHRGHNITVLTSQYDSTLPLEETRDGVRVVRLPVRMRVSKGVIMPGMIPRAWQLARQADIVNLHVPQLDAAPISVISRILRKPVVLTYQCDLRLPAGTVNFVANQVSHLANHISAMAANAIVSITRDYAENSAFLRPYMDKVHTILPPVELPPVTPEEMDAFRKKYRIEPGQKIIGMAARLASEKGVEYLVQALPAILEKYPQARVLYVGQFKEVFGEQAYALKLQPMIDRLGEHWQFLGILENGEFTAFMKAADVLVLPSLNSTEAFGMVQVEAMTCGTPVVATDLPGVRQPVLMTGMGEIVPVADADSLARAVIQVLDRPDHYHSDPGGILQKLTPDAAAKEYEDLFASLLRREGFGKN
jgi:glycosyltransferase involved in cell wall biosynthesis